MICVSDAESWCDGARPPVSFPLELNYIMVGRIGTEALMFPLTPTQFALVFSLPISPGCSNEHAFDYGFFFKGKSAEGIFLSPFLC